MTTNGRMTETDLTLDEALDVLRRRRADVLRQRKGLEIDHRIQQKLGAGPDVLKEIKENLRRVEIALEELDAIEREWTAGAL